MDSNRRHRVNLGIFLVAVTGALALLLCYSPMRQSTSQIKPNARSLSALSKTYKEKGIQRFLEEKQVLKAQVEQSLKSPSSEEEAQDASNVALYLFPDALPDSNFEKEPALDGWAPLQAEIEKAPGTADSRLKYEEMRANIWNYENPKQDGARVSPYAEETLKMYSGLTGTQ